MAQSSNKAPRVLKDLKAEDKIKAMFAAKENASPLVKNIKASEQYLPPDVNSYVSEGKGKTPKGVKVWQIILPRADQPTNTFVALKPSTKIVRELIKFINADKGNQKLLLDLCDEIDRRNAR